MGSEVLAYYKTGTALCQRLSIVSLPPSHLLSLLVRSFERGREGPSSGKGKETLWGPWVGEGQIITSLLALEMFQERTGFTCSVEEEEACSMRGGHVLGHVADLQVVDETPEEEQEACRRSQNVFSAGSTSQTNDGKTLTEQQEDPPEPVLPVKVAGEVIGKLDEEEKKAIIGNTSRSG